MAWFDAPHHFDKTLLRIAHVTDCHLFADKQGEYFGVNSAAHLALALDHMAQQQVDAVVFGGDLTQDHSVASYQLFAQLVHNSRLTCPLFWLPGNHDEIALLVQMSGGQISTAKRLIAKGVEILLLNSKGPTPAGWISAEHLTEISSCLTQSANTQLLFCHHNPLPINGYLDKHMLENGPQLLNTLVNNGQVAALFHGHVHNDYQQRFRTLDIYATPASSVQFTKYSEHWQQQNRGPAYRMLTLNTASATLQIKTDVVWLNG
jgi:3',5'-cyclic-AMP phosphodiesterase